MKRHFWIIIVASWCTSIRVVYHWHTCPMRLCMCRESKVPNKNDVVFNMFQLDLGKQKVSLYTLQPYILASAAQSILLVMGNMWHTGVWAFSSVLVTIYKITPQPAEALFLQMHGQAHPYCCFAFSSVNIFTSRHYCGVLDSPCLCGVFVFAVYFIFLCC